MHIVTQGSFHKYVIVLQVISDRKCLSQGFGRSRAKKCILYYYIFFKNIYFIFSFHKGKNVHIADLYVVPTLKDEDVDPVHCLPVSFFFCYPILIN